STFFVGLAIMGLLIALGSNGFLYRVLYTVFPPFRVMRAPGRALFFVSFASPVLFGLLLNRLQNQPRWSERVLRGILIFSGMAWFALLVGLGASWSFTQDVDLIGRRWHQLTNVAIVGAALLVGVYLLRWMIQSSVTLEKSKKAAAFSVLLLLLIFDLGWFGRKLISPQPMTPNALWFEAAQILENDGSLDGRILPWGVNIFAQNGAGQVGLTSIFGYNTLENGAVTGLAASVPDPRSKAYDVLGVTHVVSESGLEQFTSGKRGLNLVDQINITRVYVRPTRLPYARLVGHAEAVDSTETLYLRLHDSGFDPAETLLVLNDPACQLSGSATEGRINIVKREARLLRLAVEVDQPAYLVIAETNFPGWYATVDGSPVQIEQAYGAIQAICVPAGQSKIELAFRPMIFAWGGALSALGLIVVWFTWYRRRT
ncbi:MAG: YfhO family protein, partial [Chloroflexota bacterium]